MNGDIQRARDSLIQRGVELGAPTEYETLKRIGSDLNVTVGSGFTSVYMAFDGFEAPDSGSYLRLWSLDEIKKNHPIYKDDLAQIGSNYLIIGDFLMESDYIICDVGEDVSTLRLLHDDRIGASDIISFITSLSKGNYDFVK